MEYVRRLYTLPKDLAERLNKERNMSGTVVDALNLYYKSKDSVKKVVQLAERLEARLDQPVYTSTHLTVAQQLEAMGLKYDHTRNMAFDESSNRYLPIKVENGKVTVLGEW